MAIGQSDLIGVRDAAERLGVHENTVRRWADAGVLGSVRLPSGVRRIRRADVAALERDMLAAPGRGKDDRIPESSWEPKSVEQLADEQGVEPIASLDDLAADIWESDEELVEFLAEVRASRS